MLCERAASTFREQQPRRAPVRSEWSDAAIAILRARWAEGFSASQIATMIEREAGQRCTRNAVIGKMHRLGLAGRASHVRSAKTIRNRLANARLRLNEAAPKVGPRRLNRAALWVKRCALAQALPPAPNADGEFATVLNVRDGECRFIAGDPLEGAPFCGRPTETRGAGAHAPFCPAHARICYLPTFFGAVRP
jgi:GcrA cell cycle regulator